MEGLKVNDFVFKEYNEKYGDIWYYVTGNSQKILTKRYMEMCMVNVTEIIYNPKEKLIGVKRQFPFNYDVIFPEDIELEEITKHLNLIIPS